MQMGLSKKLVGHIYVVAGKDTLLWGNTIPYKVRPTTDVRALLYSMLCIEAILRLPPGSRL